MTFIYLDYIIEVEDCSFSMVIAVFLGRTAALIVVKKKHESQQPFFQEIDRVVFSLEVLQQCFEYNPQVNVCFIDQ